MDQGGCVSEEGQGGARRRIKVGVSLRRGRVGPEDGSRWVCLGGWTGRGRKMDQGGCVSEDGQGGAGRWIKVGVSLRRGRAGPEDGSRWVCQGG